MAQIQRTSTARPSLLRRRGVLFGIVALVVVLGVAGWLYQRSRSTGDDLVTSSKGERQQEAKSDKQGSQKPVGNPDATVPGGSTGTGDQSEASQPSGDVVMPTGAFVSNHRPNLSGSPAPNSLNSTCVTTAGARCEIHFTKDGVIKTLPAKTTDKDGVASWDWKLSDIGLTEGSWKVEAIASSGSTIRTAQDTIALEVRP